MKNVTDRARITFARKMPLIFEKFHCSGFIKANERRYFIKIYLPDESNWDAEDLVIDWRLHALLNEPLKHFIRENSKNVRFTEFFSRLEKFVQCRLKDDIQYNIWTQDPLKAYNHYKCLEEELKDVQDFVRDVNPDENLIYIESVDTSLRVHKAVLKVTENYPKEPVKVHSHDLPLCDGTSFKNILNLNEINTISGFCKKFVQCLENFQDFWNNVFILDLNCWILDPENPTFKDIKRRIKISDRISVVLTFNPYKGRHRPDIKFLGCHSTVSEFRETLQKNLENEVWDLEQDVLTNLMNVLEVRFPVKTENAKDECLLNLVQVGECAICFTVRLEDDIPSVICDNSNCMSHYHSVCLFRYLSSVPGNKNFFGRIQGGCPNCDQVILCTVPKLN